jgi:hypothetical protein
MTHYIYMMMNDDKRILRSDFADWQRTSWSKGCVKQCWSESAIVAEATEPQRELVQYFLLHIGRRLCVAHTRLSNEGGPSSALQGLLDLIQMIRILCLFFLPGMVERKICRTPHFGSKKTMLSCIPFFINPVTVISVIFVTLSLA